MKSRKEILFYGGLLSAICGGCATDGNEDSDTSSSAESDADTDADTNADAGESTDAAVDSWVNIINVAATGSEGAYTFDVTIESSDIDCTQYANWWEVLTEDGALVYRRILEHPHTEGMTGNPVTRSGGPVNVSATDTVIVRGHMNNAGYIGMAMRGSVEGGFENTPDIDSDFAADVEDDDPQPGECIPEEDIVGG